MDIKGKKILFLGDSITEGHGVSCEQARFTNLLEKQEHCISVNYGIGGTRIAYQKNPSEEPHWDLNFIDRVEQMEEKADCVVVFGGTNDFCHGDAAIGTMEDRTPWTFYGALHTLYSKLICRYPYSDIIVITPLHREDEEQRVHKGGLMQTVTLKQYVGIIKEVAEYYSLPVLDLYAGGRLQPQIPVLKEIYVPDGLHPNDEGHKILCKKIAGFLKAM